MRKMHEAKIAGNNEVVIWGTGKPMREFMHSDDMADACVYLMSMPDDGYGKLTASTTVAPLVNVGTGADQTITELAQLVAKAVGYTGRFVFDATKPDGTPRKLLDVSRLHACGWRPNITLEQGLTDAYKDFLRMQG